MAGAGARRRLGQNFLVHKKTAGRLVRALRLEPGERVLEIGPGRGILTRQLLRVGADLVAVEIDRNLVAGLQRDLADPIREGRFRLVAGDIIDFDIDGWAAEMGGRAKLLGNLPYSRTKAIIEKLIDCRHSLRRAVITVQAEVGRRLLASPGGRDYGALSIFVQYHTHPEFVADLPANYFRPAPKVDSMSVALDFLEKSSVAVEDEELFFRLVRTAFTQRRKTVRNALAVFLEGFKSIADPGDFIVDAGIDPSLRPEALALRDYAALSNRLKLMMEQDRT